MALAGLAICAYPLAMDGEHRKTCRRYNEPWHAHFLTFSCLRRQRFFSGNQAPLWFLESLQAARRKEDFDLWAYVIMPEHAHLVICPNGEYSISKILSRIKWPVARRAVQMVRRDHPEFLPKMAQTKAGKVVYRFWQEGGGYDRNLWTAKEIHEKVAYVHNNPVGRGLVQKPEDWPWSSYRAWEFGSAEPVPIDAGTVPVIAR